MTTEASNLNNSDPEQGPPPLNELYVIPSPDIFSFMYLNDLYQQLIDNTTTSLRTENPLEPRDGVITREEFVQHYGDNYKFNNRDIFRVTNIGGIIYYANVRSLTNPCFVDTGLLLFPGGVSYDGSFYLGKPHYYGKLAYSNGDEYSGQFKNGFLEGEGLYHYKNHDRWKSYSGWWLRGKRQGGGKLLYRNGMIELKEYSYDVEISSITPDRIMEENTTINQWLLERRPTIFQNSEPASSIPSSFQSLDTTPQQSSPPQSSLPSPPHSPPPQSSLPLSPTFPSTPVLSSLSPTVLSSLSPTVPSTPSFSFICPLVSTWISQLTSSFIPFTTVLTSRKPPLFTTFFPTTSPVTIIITSSINQYFIQI